MGYHSDNTDSISKYSKYILDYYFSLFWTTILLASQRLALIAGYRETHIAREL